MVTPNRNPDETPGWERVPNQTPAPKSFSIQYSGDSRESLTPLIRAPTALVAPLGPAMGSPLRARNRFLWSDCFYGVCKAFGSN
jgi:hypothetical protein